ncbi:cytidylyltransferase domain-containing protein [Sporosarcina cascadiensis]|uniref:cytidylyltransferase domain-containing protein n=1 Tax=Sporosarcina cascadiensis TaxID=2660747 RepID=UPI00129BEC04|nr:glycosyltransferase family protein [Sporosarcina cascadiensis]
MKIVAIIQARMTSTRLPGKVLKKVMDKTLLEYQLERVSRSQLINEIIVATTTNETDDPIVNLCKQLGYTTYRGSEEDVLSRYYGAAMDAKAEVVVRLTSDCPLIDPAVIDQVIQLFIDNCPNVDYVSNTLERTYPRGMDTEVMSMNALIKAYRKATLESDREHVTAYIYSNESEYSLLNLKSSEVLSQYRWTVDTIEDFELIQRILMELYPFNNNFSQKDIIDLLTNHHDWSLINAHIEQKEM